jgi:putative membrane protein
VFGARAAGAGAEARPAGATDAAFFRMRTGDVLLFGLLSQKGLLYVGGFLVALREFASWEKVEQQLGTGYEVLAQGSRLVGPLGWLVLGLSFLLLLQALTVLWALLTLFGFRIERSGEDLRTTCGLFTRQTASLPRGRVQFLEVRASPLQRLLGRVSVRALSAGGDSTERSQVARKWLVPLCSRAELAAVLAEVQPEAAFDAVAWRPVHPRAVRRLTVKWAFWLECLAAIAWWHSWWLGLGSGAVALAAALGLARLRARALGWALGERAVFLRDGILTRRLACVRFEKVQSIKLSQTPLDRRARMARVSVDTAAPSGSDLRFVIPFLGLREALRLGKRLKLGAAAVRFRW